MNTTIKELSEDYNKRDEAKGYFIEWYPYCCYGSSSTTMKVQLVIKVSR